MGYGYFITKSRVKIEELYDKFLTKYNFGLMFLFCLIGLFFYYANDLLCDLGGR